MARFKVGDRVQLNSGGAVLTVMGVTGTEVMCAWRDVDGNWLERNFAEPMLKFAGTENATATLSDFASRTKSDG